MFAAAVIVYVVYGGFRAVVWTDVMQGFVMFTGVVIMLVLALAQVGGLDRATRTLIEMTPPEFGTAVLERNGGGATAESTISAGWWLPHGDTVAKITASVPVPPGASRVEAPVLVVTSESDAARVRSEAEMAEDWHIAELGGIERYAYGAGRKGVYASAPGPHREKPGGLVPLGVAFSMFVFWSFGAAGQPANMVRLMAFRDTPTLRRAIVTVSVYYSVIYFSLVIIFCCARVLLPGMDHDSDRIMPELATRLTAAAGWPWLAGLLLAAPFAAVMSSVDSFLLMVSSSLVRDVYQRRVNPRASERRLRRLAHWVTALTGAAAVLAILNPPEHLQYLIIFASGGLAGCFLMPVVFALYWPRMNAAGMLAGMLGGFGAHAAITLAGYFEHGEFRAGAFLGLDPFLWDLLASTVLLVGVTLATPPPERRLVRQFFGAKR